MIAKSLKNFKTENCGLAPEKLGMVEQDPYTGVNYRTTMKHLCEMTMEKANHRHRIYRGMSKRQRGM